MFFPDAVRLEGFYKKCYMAIIFYVFVKDIALMAVTARASGCWAGSHESV